MSTTDRLQAFINWANTVESERNKRYQPKPKPPVIPKPLVYVELDLCEVCLANDRCSRDYADLVYGREVTKHGKNVLDCEHLEDKIAPSNDVKCWFCGKPECDNWMTVNRIIYKQVDYSQQLTLPLMIRSFEVEEIKSRVNVPVHMDCMPEE